jgi:hypothetical protein
MSVTMISTIGLANATFPVLTTGSRLTHFTTGRRVVLLLAACPRLVVLSIVLVVHVDGQRN